ncbi:MAG TPA: alpha/beta fold hydrolase [Thermoanaerobaculia bacterium]|nr:alpha/beta fold hydrolase [Thermoanaerobaculia bacterium]
MRTRQYHHRRKRSRSLLWILLGLCGLGLTAVLVSRRRGEEEAEPEPGRGPEEAPGSGYPEPAPPESLSVWIAGPAGNLYVRDGGVTESGALPVLFLHSLAGNGGQWALQLDHLRRRRRAVALDLRGHGDSDPAEDGDYSIGGLAGDVEAAADQLGLRRFVLVGHSLGGSVAIEYAGRHPERVAGLLLVDPNGDQTRVPRDQVEPFLASVREDPLGELESYYRQLVLGGDRDAGRWVLEDLRLTHEDAIPRALEAAMQHSPLPALARYQGPKLSVVSEMNQLPYSLHRLVPGLPTQLMHGTGHWLMMDRPEAFNHLLDDFLDTADAGARR